MGTVEVPDFLTVEEAGRVLRIGPTTAYKQAHQWVETGREGLPAIWVGGSLRVPLAQFEHHYNISVTAIPPPPERQRPTEVTEEFRSPAQDIPRSEPSARRRKSGGTTQDGLPFAG